jgi:transcriptional regulator with XRE-family HTH domain
MGTNLSIEESFGQVIRNLRKERKLSQEKLSDTSGLDRSFISHLERGRKQPSLVTIFQLAKALNVSPTFIIAATEEKHKVNEY